MSKVLVIGDTHAPCMHPGYVPFLKKVQKAYKCNTVVHIGDVVDWQAISFHDAHPDCPSAKDEYKLALKQVQQLYRAFPKSIVMTGNHDSLPMRQARAAGIPGHLLRSYAEVWKTPGWQWRPRYDVYHIDGVAYCHGDKGKGGLRAAARNAQENFCSWVQGHLHSRAGVEWLANEKDLVFGMHVGCGVDHKLAAFEYQIKFNAKPILGCGVVIDGRKAYWEPMFL